MGGALLMAASMPRAAAGAGVSVTTQAISKVGAGSSSVSGSYTLDTDGKVYGNGTAELETWLISGAAADYEVRATLQFGTTPTSGTMDTWLALSIDRTWTLTVAAGNAESCRFLVEIRDAATSTVIDSASILISVDNLGGA